MISRISPWNYGFFLLNLLLLLVMLSAGTFGVRYPKTTEEKYFGMNMILESDPIKMFRGSDSPANYNLWDESRMILLQIGPPEQEADEPPPRYPQRVDLSLAEDYSVNFPGKIEGPRFVPAQMHISLPQGLFWDFNLDGMFDQRFLYSQEATSTPALLQVWLDGQWQTTLRKEFPEHLKSSNSNDWLGQILTDETPVEFDYEQGLWVRRNP